jgi:NAD(P)H-quinone oxidoreductase subunit 5
MDYLLIGLVAAPGALFVALSLVWLLGAAPGEKVVARLTAAVSSFGCLAAAALGWHLLASGQAELATAEWPWFQAGGYHFELSLFVDRLSWPLVMLTTVLVGLVGVFSVRYLHRDRGYFRFFLLLNLFASGALLVFTAASLDLLLAGWELVGITSVLLIAFFDDRREPVRNAGRVFAFYRVADLGLLTGIFVIHTFAHTARLDQLFPGAWPDRTSLLTGWPATLVALLLLMAAAGKSAQVPFSGWLPRAMEGPTPSSAIFYGAISVHLGAYLLLRIRPVLEAAPWAAAAVVTVGAVTALLATLVHRACTDAKTSLAYAGMAQVGIVFVEIGLGYPRLAVAHLVGHAVVRTLQFLRAPSMLHDYHRVHAAAGGHLGRTGVHYERLLPGLVRIWLYRAAIERGYYDALVDRVVLTPVMRFARWCEGFEPGVDGRPPAAEALPAPEASWAERTQA